MVQSPVSLCPAETFNIIKWILLKFSWGIYSSCTVFDHTNTEWVWITAWVCVYVYVSSVFEFCIYIHLVLCQSCIQETLPVLFQIYSFKPSFLFHRALMPKQTYILKPPFQKYVLNCVSIQYMFFKLWTLYNKYQIPSTLYVHCLKEVLSSPLNCT
jgi:hypothetical protein